MLPFAKILPKFFNSKVTSRSFVSRSVVRSKSAGHDDHAHHEHLMFEPPFAMSTVLPAVLFIVFGGVGVVLGAVYHQQRKHGYLNKKQA